MAAVRPLRACAMIALGGLALRLALLARPLVVLDRFFLPDDAYYTLAIARSIARGLGPSADGVHLTSGFQPLLALLLVPALRASEDPDTALRAALGLGALADALSAWLLGWLAARLAGRLGEERAAGVGAVVATSIWALSPTAIATSLNGLETSLAIACVLGAVAAWSIARARGRLLAWASSGALLGLCLVARVDTVFLVAAVGVATLARGGPRAAAASAAGGLLTVGPWWAYALARFGTIVPESGAAVREQALMYRAAGLNVRDQLAWAAGAVTGPPLVDSTWLREALGSGASAIGCAIGCAIVLALFAVVRARGRLERAPDELRILATYAGCLFLFYALYLPATWFFRRYLAPVHALTTLAAALAVARAWRDAARWRPAALAGLAACGLVAIVAIARFATSRPAMTVDQGHHGAKGYREPARQVLALAPPGAVIGSFQSGALGWFADGAPRRVVNLDGVVDGEAARAVRSARIGAFARSRGVTHLADWEVNVKLFLDRAGDGRIGAGTLRKIGEAEPQGEGERFALYAVDWPE